LNESSTLDLIWI